MENGERLMLNLRIAGQATDIMEAPAAFDVRDGVLLLYSDLSGATLPYAGYALGVVEHFEIIPEDQVEDYQSLIDQREQAPAVDLNALAKESNPFRGGRLKFKEES